MKNNHLKSLIYPLKALIPDEIYLKMQYKHHFGERLNLKDPKTFNEKLQWLKLHNRDPYYNKLVDKYLVREYIEQKIGEQYLIPLIAVYEKVDDINWDELPEKFVLKCTHGSKSNIICTDKNKLNIKEAKQKLNKWMQWNWFWYGREWPYKNVKPRIICEKLMVDGTEPDLKDYKILCFNGEPKIVQVDYNRYKDHKRNLYDTDWNVIPVTFVYPSDSKILIKKPEKLDEMLRMATILSKNHPHLRVDFYSINNEIYFGELTFYPEAGFGTFEPNDFDKTVGTWINLPTKSEV